jgi:hypothetical protein
MVDSPARWLPCALLILVACSACATVQDKYVATPLNERGQIEVRGETASGLLISGEEATEYASQHFGLVQVTFENTSADWVRVGRLSLDFGHASTNAAVSVSEGPDIDAWISATLQRNVVRDTNRAIALGTLLAIGVAVESIGAVSGRKDVAAAGSVLELGAAGASVVDTFAEAGSRSQHGRLFPGSHLLAQPFAVPPGLFSKRWVLLYTREPGICIRSMRLDYEVEGRGSESALLVFRRPQDRSEWQRAACEL